MSEVNTEPVSIEPVKTETAPVTVDHFSELKDKLPEELKESPLYSKYTSFEDMFRGHNNVNQMIGGSKVAIPDNLSSDEDRIAAHKQLSGLKDLESYGVDAPEGVFDKEGAVALKKGMFEAGIGKAQANKLFKVLSEMSKAGDETYKKQVKDRNLDWESRFLDMTKGNLEESTLAETRSLAKLGSDFKDSVDVKNPQIRKLLIAYGKMIGDANITTETSEASKTALEETHQEQKDILEKLSSMNHDSPEGIALQKRYQRNRKIISAQP